MRRLLIVLTVTLFFSVPAALSQTTDGSAVITGADVTQPVQDSAPLNVSQIPYYKLLPDILNLAVIIVFVILLWRTAAPLVHSRYLKHLGGAYALIGLFYLSSILLVQYGLILFVSAQGRPSSDISKILVDLANVGELIKLIFSSLSSCFLLLTWYLLHHHPKEGVSQKFYGGVFTAYCVVVPAVVAVAQKFKWSELKVLNVIDSVFALIGVLMVGLGLCQLIRTKKKLSRPLRDIMTFLVAAAFLGWGLPQPLYEWYKGHPWFWFLLAFGKIAAGLAAILVSVIVLQAKPGFQAPNDA